MQILGIIFEMTKEIQKNLRYLLSAREMEQN